MTPTGWQARKLIEQDKHRCRIRGCEADERDEAVVRPTATWKAYPCLLTRRELQDVVAKQLG
jgi:hypothetical protein